MNELRLYDDPTPLRLREPPDCTGCVAPCCLVVRFNAPIATARAVWREAGAHLVEVLPGGYRCTALGKDGRCTIYAKRPQPCRDYDCRPVAAIGFVPSCRI